jgi:hypothetical protein
MNFVRYIEKEGRQGGQAHEQVRRVPSREVHFMRDTNRAQESSREVKGGLKRPPDQQMPSDTQKTNMQTHNHANTSHTRSQLHTFSLLQHRNNIEPDIRAKNRRRNTESTKEKHSHTPTHTHTHTHTHQRIHQYTPTSTTIHTHTHQRIHQYTPTSTTIHTRTTNSRTSIYKHTTTPTHTHIHTQYPHTHSTQPQQHQSTPPTRSRSRCHGRRDRP